LLGTPRQFRLYTSGLAFAEDGRVAVGEYDPKTGRVGLLLSRLFEGFNGPTPGVAPFLHELGHMLDYFDAARGVASRHGSGFLPGMRPEDGDLYTPEARALFVQGKRLELERYLRLWHGRGTPSTPLPIGSPYVFQNDSEFLAGYLELFFRNPHYFAAQNPDLYQAFVSLFRQDPRRSWVEDFPFYVEENRDFYLRAPRRPPPPGLFLPAA
ncbi:MAG TPA: zinc-dependent peptidase, partial [Ardenticatenaceae bacterium]|nr:zinc-dependent peptidase [Ardenticatenaceae bacterium]